jgi:hypothetical protein
MNITAKITGTKYNVKFIPKLKEFSFSDIDINNLPASCAVKHDNFSIGLSKWVSPKRTRSYPYSRVYNTLGTAKKVTVIPIVKDEGISGDRDFIQWDTVSLMSLLDVYVILAYYSDAQLNLRKADKITKQQFDNEFIKQKIIEIKNYHNSALHWNLKEVQSNFPKLTALVTESYNNIGSRLGVKFHSIEGLIRFSDQFLTGVEIFKETSRKKSKEAQDREMQTVQPKEFLTTRSKAKISITNYLGGEYYFTTDEVLVQGEKLYLIESKHSKNDLLPSIDDIKDGLLKMILYTNLENVQIGNCSYEAIPVLKLTSSKIEGEVFSYQNKDLIDSFFKDNSFPTKKNDIIKTLFEEASENNFIIKIGNTM